MVAPTTGCWPPWTLPDGCELMAGMECQVLGGEPQPAIASERRRDRERGTARRRTIGHPEMDVGRVLVTCVIAHQGYCGSGSREEKNFARRVVSLGEAISCACWWG